MSGEIVPFGKYKGQPIEVMTADQQYVEWLKQQPWFKDKYTNVYNTIINYAQEPAETPEHNALQIKFLDEIYIKKFTEFVIGGDWKYSRHEIQVECGQPPIDVVLNVFYERVRADDDLSLNRIYYQWKIEIKPTIGDDYPTVFRQMQRSGAKILLVGAYTGVGATETQFRAFFATAGMRVICISEIEKT